MTRSILSEYSTVGLQLTQLKTNSVATLLSGGNTIAAMTNDICTAASDSSVISSIARRVADVANVAAQSGASGESLENISGFASALQEEGYGTLSIITYLGKAQDLAESDINAFNEVFSGSGDTTKTRIASIEAGPVSGKTGADTDVAD